MAVHLWPEKQKWVTIKEKLRTDLTCCVMLNQYAHYARAALWALTLKS